MKALDELDPYEYKLFATIIKLWFQHKDRCSMEDWFWHSLNELCKASGMGETKLKQSLNVLVEKRYISKISNNNNDGKANYYQPHQSLWHYEYVEDETPTENEGGRQTPGGWSPDAGLLKKEDLSSNKHVNVKHVNASGTGPGKNDFSNEKRIFSSSGDDVAYDNPKLREFQRKVDEVMDGLGYSDHANVVDNLNHLWEEAGRHTYDRDEYIEYFNRSIDETGRRYGWTDTYIDRLLDMYNSDGLIVEESYGDRIGQYISDGILPLSPSCASPLSPHNSKIAHWEATG